MTAVRFRAFLNAMAGPVEEEEEHSEEPEQGRRGYKALT